MLNPQSPLSTYEDDLLEAGGRDFDRALGAPHAVAVEPGLVPPPVWIPEIVGERTGLGGDRVQTVLGSELGRR